MGEINISRSEQEALRAIDCRELHRLVDQALREERTDVLSHLSLAKCGPFVAEKLRSFDQALLEHTKAKSPKKRAETQEGARRAGSDMVFAVEAMQDRMVAEEEQGQLFYVDDDFPTLPFISKHLSVTVHYRWRRRVGDAWTDGSIRFIHEVEVRPDYTAPVPKRKPSAAKRERDFQDELCRTWEHLRIGALCSVPDYFKAGRDGSAIPKTYRVTTDPHSGSLNNHSTKFWLAAG
jgi:hypothetical protein